MLRRTLTLSLILTITVFLGLAYGQRHCCGGHQGGPSGMMLMECGKKIGLEEAQLDKIKSIHLSSQKQIIKLRADLEIAQLELKELMHSDSPVKSKVNRKIDELSQLKAKIHKNEAGTKIDVMSTLTAEQLERFQEYRMKRMKEARRGHRCCKDRPGCATPCMGMGKMEGTRGGHRWPQQPHGGHGPGLGTE
ncbi:MAG: periplasmic heavy metal sensor [Candidatus Zixiibacteriota bacterium]|nr:MAG: periplasmic heavy metal sensor [candidate division Zixibacteria bacterium]